MPKKMRSNKVVLPKVPSKLIEIALRDLEKTEKQDSKFEIDMSEWLSGTDNGNREVCTVCFAGSVMAHTLGFRIDNGDFDPTDDEANRQQLSALNYFRTGEVQSAMEVLGSPKPSMMKSKLKGMIADIVWDDCSVVKHEENPKLFKKQMRGLAAKFKAIGL